jgi:hypothetical protein
MRGNKILVCSALLLAFVAGISAQEKTAQYEVSIEKLLKLEDVTTLRFLISTKDDLKALFGNECRADALCVYDDDWDIRFIFAGDILNFYLSNPTEKGLGRIDSTFIKPEFKGTLVAIELSNRGYVFPENYSLPPDFDCSELSRITFCNNGETFIRYWSENGSLKKRISITHRVSFAQYKQITGETELKGPPKQKNIPPKEPRF